VYVFINILPRVPLLNDRDRSVAKVFAETNADIDQPFSASVIAYWPCLNLVCWQVVNHVEVCALVSMVPAANPYTSEV
jgi:hypothetical protein